MSRLFAGLAAIALLCAMPHSAPAAPAAPGSVDPVPAAPATPPVASPPVASPPAAAPSPTPPAAAPATPSAAVTPPASEPTTPAKPQAKKPAKRRYARHRSYGYPYWRRDPFFYAHPRFWWPFYPHRYRAYRYPRRHYYRPSPFYMFRW